MTGSAQLGAPAVIDTSARERNQAAASTAGRSASADTSGPSSASGGASGGPEMPGERVTARGRTPLDPRRRPAGW